MKAGKGAREFWCFQAAILDGGSCLVFEAHLEKIEDCDVRLIEHSAYAALKAECERLKLELDFTKQYLDPISTSFRDMMDDFRALTPEQKNKLINLAKSLAELSNG